jgi:hypothetical protein
MFPGSPARLRPAVPLHALLPLARPGVVLGIWLRECRRPVAIRCRGPSGLRHLLAADDLGYLLRRCGEVAVRDGERLRPVPTGVLIGWRVLEIVLGAPYLPSPDQLRALFPTARIRDGVLSLPVGLGSAEEALALCAIQRLPVAASRIAYSTDKR